MFHSFVDPSRYRLPLLCDSIDHTWVLPPHSSSFIVSMAGPPWCIWPLYIDLRLQTIGLSLSTFPCQSPHWDCWCAWGTWFPWYQAWLSPRCWRKRPHLLSLPWSRFHLLLSISSPMRSLGYWGATVNEFKLWPFCALISGTNAGKCQIRNQTQRTQTSIY